MKTIEGGCSCGAVRYRAAGVPVYSAICHCTSCRKAASAPSVAWLTFERPNFQVLSGTPRIYRSSPGVERTFCENCGSPLTYASTQRPEHIDVTTASLDDPEQVRPDREVWLAHRLSWEVRNAVLEGYPEGGD